ncbi:MAG: HAMP domain-containing sensor histidine kinase [Ignavibacteriaceae bacterium]|jgi:signal transduction histidine kinase
MITLVPAWAHHYDAFWDAIKRRNNWFIKLRYGAVLMLVAFLLSAEFILHAAYTDLQVKVFIVLVLAILAYNIFFQKISKKLKCIPGKFNPLHLSLVQMLFDLYVLTLLVYYTGSIESPLFMLFVFHMIIGSLILPGKIIYSLAGLVIVVFFSLTFGEYFNILTHYNVKGFLQVPIYSNLHFLLAYNVVFAFVIIFSVVIANHIAVQLYKMEQELVESINKLNEAEIEKQKYVMGVVHEIKTPLSALHSYLDLILQKYLGPLNEKVEEKLLRARIRSDEALQLTDDVLKISKLRLLDEIANEEIDLNELILSIHQQQKINIQSKNISFNLIDDRKNKRKIKGDLLLLELAFSNLINNAVKYVKENGIVEVKISSDNSIIHVLISDNGIGIPHKDLKNIFKDFYRASNIKQKPYEGTGLGLSFVKQIIERHNGEIKVESPSGLGDENNPGTSFVVTIPF